MPARPQTAPTEDWRQIELSARAPGQRTDELIRPVVLCGRSAVECAAETGAAERTLYRQVARFDQLGMAKHEIDPRKPGRTTSKRYSGCNGRWPTGGLLTPDPGPKS